MDKEVFCKCGEPIHNDDILYTNFSNEEGEEYFEVDAQCVCGRSIIVESWGWIDDVEEAKQEIFNYLEAR